MTTTRQAILDTFRELGPCGLRPVVETLELDHAEAKVIVEQIIADRHLYQQSNKQYTVKCPREQQPLRKKSRASYEERSASDKRLQSLNEHLSELGAPDVKPVIARARQFMDYQASLLNEAKTSEVVIDRLKLHGLTPNDDPVAFVDKMGQLCRTLVETAKVLDVDPMMVTKAARSATQLKSVADCTITELAQQLEQHRAAITEIRNHVQSLFDV